MIPSPNLWTLDPLQGTRAWEGPLEDAIPMVCLYPGTRMSQDHLRHHKTNLASYQHEHGHVHLILLGMGSISVALTDFPGYPRLALYPDSLLHSRHPGIDQPAAEWW